MARGTMFGDLHSNADLHLIQQKVDVNPAEPRLNLVDVPGADGSKDLSELPSGRVTFKDRTIEWTFALYPGDDWASKHSEVSGALNGRRCEITLDEDPDYYYNGRLTVSKHKVDGILRQITIKATCAPYKLRHTETEIRSTLYDEPDTVILPNGRKPVVPTIVCASSATIVFGDYNVVFAAGTHKDLCIELVEGENVVTVTSDDVVTFIYREGAL